MFIIENHNVLHLILLWDVLLRDGQHLIREVHHHESSLDTDENCCAPIFFHCQLCNETPWGTQEVFALRGHFINQLVSVNGTHWYHQQKSTSALHQRESKGIAPGPFRTNWLGDLQHQERGIPIYCISQISLFHLTNAGMGMPTATQKICSSVMEGKASQTAAGPALLCPRSLLSSLFVVTLQGDVLEGVSSTIQWASWRPMPSAWW